MDLNKTPLTLEARLCDFANLINTEIGKKDGNVSECSIYLYDYRRDMHVLRASTKTNCYIGKDVIKLTEEAESNFKAKNWDNLGLTIITILGGKTIVSTSDVLSDHRFSRCGKKDFSAQEWEDDNYCEYSLKQLGSVICSPIDFKRPVGIEGNYKTKEKLAGVVRIVRSRGRQFKPFNEDDDARELEKIIKENLSWIKSGVFISQLIELGTYMNVANLCTKAAEVFKNMLYCKGCSIFLLDESDHNCSEDNKIYKCYGTTGLVKRFEENNTVEEIENPLTDEDSWYTYKPSKYKTAKVPTMPLTLGVIRARTSAFVNDIYDETEISAQFPEKYKIRRERKVSHVCEKGTTVDDKHIHSEGILYAPIYFCDPNDKDIDVLGVVRLVRPREEDKRPHKFTQDEIHLFVSLVERLSQAVLTAKFIEFLDEMGQKDDIQALLKYVVSNIPKYIGATECAVLIVEGDKLVKKASWQKGLPTFFDGNAEYTFDYDLSDPVEKGYTYYVARHKQPLIFNGLTDLKKQFPNREIRPEHKTKEKGLPPHRYLGVPVLDMAKNLIAVIRICKNRDATRLTKEDLQMMLRIASHLGPHIEQFKIIKHQETELENRIPEPLQCMIRTLKEVKCRSMVQENLLGRRRYGGTVEDTIIEFIPKLWNFYRPSFGKGGVDIIKRFELFNNHILSEIPRYRDHYIHQLIVFLIGTCIIDKLKSISENPDDLEKNFKNAYHRLRFKEKVYRLGDIEKAWFVTALYHDIAYPLQKVNSWLWSILKIFISESVTKNRINISLSEILFNPDYIENIDELAKFHTDDLMRSEPNIRKAILEVLVDKTKEFSSLDHGIMGALILLSNQRFELMEILPSASAIALHNKLLERSEINAIYFERHPLAFILIYCDLLHEWSRNVRVNSETMSHSYPCLKKFIVTRNWEQMRKEEHDIEDFVQIEGDMADKPCVFTEINLDDYIVEKQEEALRKFEKLKSNKFNFLMKINHKYYATLPDN